MISFCTMLDPGGGSVTSQCLEKKEGIGYCGSLVSNHRGLKWKGCEGVRRGKREFLFVVCSHISFNVHSHTATAFNTEACLVQGSATNPPCILADAQPEAHPERGEALVQSMQTVAEADLPKMQAGPGRACCRA
eukprot:525170-Pelagomonas_calceolata.AAC.2